MVGASMVGAARVGLLRQGPTLDLAPGSRSRVGLGDVTDLDCNGNNLVTGPGCRRASTLRRSAI